jgi:hypothetical protein
MTESWLDKSTGMVMNQNPGAAFLRKFGDRFEFIDYSFSEVLKEMHDLIALVRHECNPARAVRYRLRWSGLVSGAD